MAKEGKGMHFQDPVLNLHFEQRDTIKQWALDRIAFKNSKLKGLLNSNQADIGSSALKLRPDMNRITSGLFHREFIPDSGRKNKSALST